jgi:hypothetical protein
MAREMGLRAPHVCHSVTFVVDWTLPEVQCRESA